ncbi:hypothetical protein AB0L06_11740 [Spirillospora sp. NPDC052269]
MADLQVSGGDRGDRDYSQADSAGSIPVTRSTTKAQARDKIPSLGLRRSRARQAPRAISGQSGYKDEGPAVIGGLGPEERVHTVRGAPRYNSLLGRLNFTSPEETTGPTANAAEPAAHAATTPQALGTALPLPNSSAALQPPTVGADFAAINAALRRLYFSVQPTQLHPAVLEHTKLGTQLLAETTGVPRRILATALAEALLLVGRIEFFDLRQPDEADATYVRALQAAGEANDSLLGAAILAHAAFIPGWDGRRDESAERMRAARTYARRSPAPAEFGRLRSRAAARKPPPRPGRLADGSHGVRAAELTHTTGRSFLHASGRGLRLREARPRP